jgi:hypothetical protein
MMKDGKKGVSSQRRRSLEVPILKAIDSVQTGGGKGRLQAG